MKENKTLTVFLFICLLIIVPYSCLLASDLLNYQGKLLESGSPVSGDYTVTFSIYDQSTGGTPLWSETQTVTVQNGIFNVLLGSSTPFTEDLFSNETLYLGVQVGTSDEMSPRFQLAATAYSLQAAMASDIQEGVAVTSINGLTDDVTLEAGSNVSLTADQNTLTIAASAGGGDGLPTGAIIMWWGSVDNIPAGWALCDGTQGTPDLRGMFVLGAGGVYSVADTGGDTTHTHTAGTYTAASHTHDAGSYAAPAHTHGAGTYASSAHTHGAGTYSIGNHTHGAGSYELNNGSFSGGNDSPYRQVGVYDGNLWANGGSGGSMDRWVGDQVQGTSGTASAALSGSSATGGSGSISGTSASGGSGTITGTSASGGEELITGESEEASSMPPYFALAYIMKL